MRIFPLLIYLIHTITTEFQNTVTEPQYGEDRQIFLK